MSIEISKSRFKARALEIFRQIELGGEPVVITDHGKPTLIVKKYIPAAAHAHRLEGSVLRYDEPLEPVAEEDWEAFT